MMPKRSPTNKQVLTQNMDTKKLASDLFRWSRMDGAAPPRILIWANGFKLVIEMSVVRSHQDETATLRYIEGRLNNYTLKDYSKEKPSNDLPPHQRHSG